MPPTNHAAYCIKPGKGLPLEVREAPYTPPRADELVVRSRAVAINPVDAHLIDMGHLIFTHLKYPAIYGCDVAGEVVEVGSGVTRFRPGDRVLGCGLGIDKIRNRNAESTFQEYVVMVEEHVTPMPDDLAYENAAVIPLGLGTAATALFQDDQLHLQLPPKDGKAEPKNETVIIWGGSTSVGSNAIQLARAAGYEVVTTCSPHNFAYCKSLGAAKCFDYRSSTCVADIISALKGKRCAGAVAIGNSATEKCMTILENKQISSPKFIAMVSVSLPEPLPKTFVIPRLMMWMTYWHTMMMWRRWTTGVKYKFTELRCADHGIGKAIFEDYLPEALRNGTFVAKPDPEVVGKGLEAIQTACDLLKEGKVSAKKLVVSLE